MKFRALDHNKYPIYDRWMTANGGYRKTTRAAMKWWRARNPEESRYVKVVNHPWYGAVLWTVAWESRPLLSKAQVICQYAGWRAEQHRESAAQNVPLHEMQKAGEPQFPHEDITTCQCHYGVQYRLAMDLAAKAQEVADLIPEEKP